MRRAAALPGDRAPSRRWRRGGVPGRHGRALADAGRVGGERAVAEPVARARVSIQKAMPRSASAGVARAQGAGDHRDGGRARARSRSSRRTGGGRRRTRSGAGLGERVAVGRGRAGGEGEGEDEAVDARRARRSPGRRRRAAPVPVTAGRAPPQAVTTGGPAAAAWRRDRGRERRARPRQAGARVLGGGEDRARGVAAERRVVGADARGPVGVQAGRVVGDADRGPLRADRRRASCGPRPGSRRPACAAARAIASASDANAMPGAEAERVVDRLRRDVGLEDRLVGGDRHEGARVDAGGRRPRRRTSRPRRPAGCPRGRASRRCPAASVWARQLIADDHAGLRRVRSPAGPPRAAAPARVADRSRKRIGGSLGEVVTGSS